ncbi:protein Ycf2-like [Amblyraja radiata]|uniref:protein Ycf2-like n=1 Tax=Amblyraja radiata TaxID=386614 RepID=UPI00140298FB|nr:protein Ycf2-like [Amblyraja radiata]
MEIQEDNLTQVELPIDQRPAEIVEEEENLQVRRKEGSDNERDGRLQNVGEKIGNDMLNTEETPTPNRSEEYPRSHADPRDKGKKGKAREAGPRAEKKMADPVKEEVEDAAQPGENPKGRRFHPQDPPQKGKTIEEIEAGLQMEEKIDGLAKQGKDGVEAQMEESPNAKYFSPQDPPYKVEKIIDESKADIQVDEDVVDLAGQTAGIANQPDGNLQDKRPPALLGPSQEEDTIEESEDTIEESEPELRVEEESSDLVEQEVEAASQAEEGPKDTHFPPQDLLEEEEIDESEADPQLDEEMADLAVEEGADQVQEDCEEPDQELEDSSAEQEVPLDEIESEIISALEAGTGDDNLEEILESAAESLEADENEILQAAAGLAVFAL